MPLRLVHPVHRATHRIGLYLDDLRERGLTQGEAHILALLAHSAPAKVADLHRGLAHKRSTLTSILDRLANREGPKAGPARQPPFVRSGTSRRAARERCRHQRI